jgi:Protein of unknown function (DUF3606)
VFRLSDRGRWLVRRHNGQTALETTMADDRSKRGPPDRTRINVGEAHEVAYWTKELGCSEAQLRAAVKAVGPMVASVRNHLNRR